MAHPISLDSRRPFWPSFAPRNLGAAQVAPDLSTTLDETRRRWIIKVMTTELFVAAATQKVAIYLGGENQIQFVVLLHIITLYLLAAKGCLRIHALRLALYLVMMALALVAHALSQHSAFSIPSMMLFSIIYGLYLFVIPLDRETYLRLLKNLQYATTGAALLVMSNWFTQAIGLGMPNIEAVIPSKFLFFYYVYIQPIHWGSRWIKPNGIFFLETSFVSQFIAFGLIIEVCFFRRIFVLGLLGAGLMSTFGGTGLLLVALSAVVVLFYLNRTLILALAIALPLAAAGAYGIGLLDNMAKRSDEFSQNGSSANQRFLAPIETINEAVEGNSFKYFFGIGAGNMPRAMNIAWNPTSKFFREYGMIAFMAWFVFIAYCYLGNGVPFIVGWIMFVQYHLLNGSLLVPIISVYSIIFAAGYVITDDRCSPPTPAQRPGSGRR